jgi:hypothetical protein
MSSKLVEYFNKQPRLGCLSTADRRGRVDSAYIGSIRLLDDKTATVGLGRNRTLANLQENPYAVFLIMEPGPTPPQWRGLRVYLRMTQCHTSGPRLEEKREEIAANIGAKAAEKMIQAAVTLEVEAIRPLLDAGQGWEDGIDAA